MKQKMWVLVNIKTGKLIRDNAGRIGYATRKALENCFNEESMVRYLTDLKYEIRKIEIEI